MAPSQNQTRWVIIGVIAFAAINVAIVMLVESGPSKGTAAASAGANQPKAPPSATIRPVATTKAPVLVSAVPSNSVLPVYQPTPADSVFPQPVASDGPLYSKAPPSKQEIEKLVAEIFTAYKSGDRDYMQRLAPPGTATDPTTLLQHSHDRQVGKFYEVADQLEKVKESHGIDTITEWRMDGLRLKLYRTDPNKPNGVALVFRHRDNGDWYLEGSTYMRDD